MDLGRPISADALVRRHDVPENMERTLHRAPAPVRPEEMLEHAAWLRRLAGSLVRGDAEHLVASSRSRLAAVDLVAAGASSSAVGSPTSRW
jgi:hypothetical protein